MVNVIAITLYSRENSSQREFTGSDLLLNPMDKHTVVNTRTSWMEFISSCCTTVLSSLAALLTGNFTVSIKKPTKAPVLVDAACQTEDGSYSELTINRRWQSGIVNTKEETDNDSHSWTTEVTDLVTDTDNDELEDNRIDEWDEANSSDDNLGHAMYNAIDVAIDCDCDTHVDQLARLHVIQCIEGDEASSSVHVQDYLCSCGECPHYKEIANDVAMSVKEPQYDIQHKHSITRLLQAFSTYNEVMGYRKDMIATACDCLRIRGGDEDKAFASFVILCGEV